MIDGTRFTLQARRGKRRSAGGLARPTLWYAPTLQGTGDGLTAANAKAISSLATDVNANGNTEVYGLLDSFGAYPVTGSGALASFLASGDAANKIKIYVVDANGRLSSQWFEGERTDWTLPADSETVTDVSAWTSGNKLVFQWSGGASYYDIRGVKPKRIGAVGAGTTVGAFYVGSGHSAGLSFIGCDGYNIRRLFDMSATATVSSLRISSLSVTGFSKNCIRIRGVASTGITLDYLNLNSGRQDKDNFAQCVQFEGDVDNIEVSDCIFENCHDTANTYWNGDGLGAETDVKNMVVRRCVFRGHTDGGIDIKNAVGDVLFEDCVFSGNKRNTRTWARTYAPIVFRRCTWDAPNHRGGTGGPVQVFLSGGTTSSDLGSIVHIFSSTVSGAITSATASTPYVVSIEGHNAHARLIDTTVSNPSSAADNNTQPTTSTIAKTGSALGTAPTITNSATPFQMRGSSFSTTLTGTTSGLHYRMTGGADLTDFTLTSATTLGLGSRTPLTTKTVEVTAWNDNGQAVTKSIAVANANYIWASNRGDQPTSLAPASLAYCVSKIRFRTGSEPVSDPRAIFVGYWLKDSGTSDYGAESTTGFVDYIVRGHGIEWAGQTYTKNADTNQTVTTGSFYESTPYTGLTIPANTYFWVTTFLEYTVSSNRPITYFPHSTNSEGVTYTGTLATAQTAFDNAAPANGDTTNAHGPSFIYGKPVNGPVPSIALLTDSIGTGFNDDEFTDGVTGRRLGGDAYSNRGYLRRALHGINGQCIANFGRSGSMIGGVYGASATIRRTIMDKATSHIINQLGENDLALGTSGIQTAQTSLYADWTTLGFPLYQMGFSPRTSGTFTTLAGQTALDYTTRRDMWTWYSGLVGTTLAGAWDPFLALSPSIASGHHGKWIVDSAYGTAAAHTADGRHQSHLGAKVGADALAAVGLIT